MTDIPTKLIQRHEDRLANIEKRRQARLKEKSESNESSDVFMLSFNKEKHEILVLLDKLHAAMPRIDLSSSFDLLSQKMLTIQKFVSDSSSFLPSYNIQKAHEILSKLRNDINEKRSILLPKKKFAFKSRQKFNTKTDEEEQPTGVVKESLNSLTFKESSIGFTCHTNEQLTLHEEQCTGQDINLSNLEDCTVFVYGSPSAMRIKNVINTTIFCGPVSRAVFVNNCLDSTFHLACQQLRIHSTFNAKFYIHITSKAIIEDCEEVGFGCYTWTYESIDKHFVDSGLNVEVNNWRNVDDFNWLKLDEQSPNWCLIE